MNLFGINEAKYYCSQFSGTTGNSQGSIKSFFTEQIIKNKHRKINEGTTIFNEYRDCSLRHIEKSLFLAASHYRRMLDLMVPSSSPWAYVTLYYGSWHVSNALLGMFGCTIFKNHVIDVDRSLPGNQTLRLNTIRDKAGHAYTPEGTSHRIFWDLFYKAIQSLRPMVVPARLATVLTPIGGDTFWQSDNRNNINYDSFNSISLAEDFDRRFSKANFPFCLPGILITQFQVLESLLELTFTYVDSFGLSTDALNRLNGSPSIRDKVSQLIYNKKPPGLVQKTKKSSVT